MDEDTDRLTALNRLEALLNEKDNEIGELSEKIDGLECTIRGIRSGWMDHVNLTKEQTLPVPRLEMLFMQDEDRGWQCTTVLYRMVYRHLLGHCVGIPLGRTTRDGGHGDPPIRDGKIDLPFRDGVHIRCDARTLGLPAFAVLGDRIAAMLFVTYHHGRADVFAEVAGAVENPTVPQFTEAALAEAWDGANVATKGRFMRAAEGLLR